MDTRKAMKLAPMLVMLAAMACATYAVQPDVSGPVPVPTAPAGKRPEGAGKAPPPATASRVTGAEATLAPRDPFRVASVPGPAQAGPDEAHPAPDRAEIDPYPELVAGLTLSGTFLHGRTRMAVIDGRIHEQGERLRGPGDEPSPLVVADVQATRVVLQAAPGGKRYVLVYPETWADRAPGSGPAATGGRGEAKRAPGPNPGPRRAPGASPPAPPQPPAGSPRSAPRRPARP